MHDSFKRWVVMGALASASWLVAACQSAQQPGNTFEVAPGFTRTPEQTGYNGTIRDLPTSIDPRTPEAQGTLGRSLLMDPGEQALLKAQGGAAMGGSGSTPPAQGPEGGPLYEELGSEGSTLAPSNEVPAAQGVGNDRPTHPNTPGSAPAKRDARGK